MNEVLNRKQSRPFRVLNTISAVKSGNLSNGIPYIIAGGSQEVVKMIWFTKPDRLYQSKIDCPVTTNVARGTKNHTSKQIADAFDFYGAFSAGCRKGSRHD
jgi:hypothetical protein